jgi:uncharacterized protein (UPF0335 family)
MTDWQQALANEPDFQPPEGARKMPGQGHNSVAADELRLLIERVERVEEEMKGLRDDRKDIYAEGKARGYDPRMMRQMVRERKMEKNARDEHYALEETYREAMSLLS